MMPPHKRIGFAVSLFAISFGLAIVAARPTLATEGEAGNETHWAYRPITMPDLPSNAAAAASAPVDRFVCQALSDANMRPSPAADKWTLIRRATFDLTGLPPTWEEVQSFISDSTPDAFARVVDRLLNSPRYGEQWGRHWLDIARYADTHGGAALGFTRFPYSYTYRDYVIRAFNADLPYNRFLLEQIAADEINPPVTADTLAALGFITVGRQFRNLHDTIDDRIDVVTRGLMGLTVTCARCHDHKYDDIPTADYYSLYSVFAASESPQELPVVGEPQDTPEYQEYGLELRRRQRTRDDFIREQTVVMRERLRQQVGLYLTELVKGTPEQDLSTIDLSYRTDDIRPLILDRWRNYLRRDVNVDDPVFGPWHRLSKLPAENFATECNKLIGQWRAENGDAVATPDKYHQWDAAPPRWNPRVLDAIASRKAASMLDVAAAYGELFAAVHTEWLRGCVAMALEATATAPDVADVGPEHVAVNSPVNRQLRRHLYASNSPIAIADSEGAKLLNRPMRDHGGGLAGAIAELNLNHPGSPPRAMALAERSTQPPQHVFEYGMPTERGEVVSPHFLTVLTGANARIYKDGQRRLELAQSVIEPSNPLTRRVVVNWVWQRHFGKGLVRTPDNFGVEGEPPTHPKLLDYLAARLLENGWSLKQLHREIMLSATYQQAGLENTDYRLRDPENRLLWRMPTQRIGLEAMRDAMLAVAGRLDTTMGGRAFDLFAEPSVPRRTVYGFVNRDVIPQMFSTFDMADPNACTADRPSTTVPQQSLFALNSNFIHEQATQVLTFADVAAKSDNSERVVALYRHVYAREPKEPELKACLKYVASQSDDSSAIWSRLAQALLAANEFNFVD